VVYLILAAPGGVPLFIEFSDRAKAVKAIEALKANNVTPPVILVVDK
jgi:hypothetical protein